MNLPSMDEAGKIAVGISEQLNANEQAFFVAGFQECVKYLSNNKIQSDAEPWPSATVDEDEKIATENNIEA